MVAERPINRRKCAVMILMAVALFSVTAALAAPVSADLPRVRDNGDGTHTVTWRMNTTDGLLLQGVELANGNVTLPWKSHNLTWAGASAFAANASVASNLSFDADGVSLRADPRNFIADGNFSTAAPWSFLPSAGGNVTVVWENDSAIFRHASPSTDSLWDGLNSTA